MRSALISRTKRRGVTALALRLFFLTASDMWHLYCDLTRYWSVLDRDCAANACHDIEWDDHRWNGCAASSRSYGRFVLLIETLMVFVRNRPAISCRVSNAPLEMAQGSDRTRLS